VQNFLPFLQNVMSERIKALRNSMSAGGQGSKHAQAQAQPAYGE
jgi:hypothetical protein